MSLSVDKPQKILIKNTMLCIWLQSRSIKHQRYIDQCCRVTERELDDPSSCKAGNWQIYRLCCQLQSLLMWEKSGSLSNWIINCKKKPIWTCNQKTSFIDSLVVSTIINDNRSLWSIFSFYIALGQSVAAQLYRILS